MSGRLKSRVKTERPSQSVPPSEFWLPLLDSGSGAVSTTLARGSGSATFTRAGATATTVLSTGLVSSAISANTARSYYDPTTLQYLGYLAEEARTNLALQSADFSTTWTLEQATLSANSLTSPDGTATADKLQEDNTNNWHRTVQTYTKAASAIAYAFSVWVKAGERTWVGLQVDDTANGARAWFNLTTGATGTVSTFGGTPFTSASASIQSFPNGWYRCVLVSTSSTSASYVTRAFTATGDTATTFVGTTGSGVYLWGAQLEAGAFATSYIPTAAATVTRAADVLTIPSASNIANATGTAFARITTVYTTSLTVSPGIIDSFNGAAEGAPMLIQNGTGKLALYDGTAVRALDALSIPFTTPTRLATTWGGASCNGFVNGAKMSTNGTFDGSLNIAANIGIGCEPGTANRQPNGCIIDIRIWQRVLSDSQIASIL